MDVSSLFIKTRALEPEPRFFRGAGALCEIQVELEPVV